MSFKIAEAFVEVSANTKPLSGALAQAKHQVASAAAAMNSLLANVGVGIGVGGLSAGMFGAVKAAASLNETISKGQQVFKASFGGVQRTAEGLASQFGMIKQETLDAAASFGLIGQAAGMTTQQAAGLSNQLLKLAADATSFFDVPLDVALEKIRSGLIGEAEPMRAFGVLLNEDAVKAEALNLGLVKSAKGMTDQAKVAARASLIMKGMTAASGDLERTQDSLSNQMRKFSGDLENFKVDMGKSLIGPTSEAIKLMRELNDTFKLTTGGMKGEGAGDFFGGIVSGMRLINQGFQKGMGMEGYGLGGKKGKGWLGLGLREAFKAAFFPDQAEADRMAGVKTGLGKPAAAPAPPAPPAWMVEAFRRKRIGEEGDKFNAKTQTRAIAEGFKDAARTLAARGGALGGLFSGNRVEQMIGEQALGKGPGALLIRGALAGARKIGENAETQKPIQPQFFEGGRDYSRSIQTQILQRESEEKKRLASIEKGNKTLEEIRDAIKAGFRSPVAAFG